MKIFKAEIIDGLQKTLSSINSIAYSSEVIPCKEKNPILSGFFKTLASVDDDDLYYTQSILVSSSWNKNDDIFDKSEVWLAKNSPEHKPTNLEHDESAIVGHIISNWPITEDGILIDEKTPGENLPDKYHILTGSVIYKSYTLPDLKQRADSLISDIEGGNKFVSMECFFKGFDYGLLNKETNEYKILARNDETAYLTKHLRAYGGIGEHENYILGRVLRNITFSGKGYVDKPANPDSIIFSRDSFKFLNLEKNDDISKSGVLFLKSDYPSENKIMSKESEAKAVDCSEATLAAETIAIELKSQIEQLISDNETASVKSKQEIDTMNIEHEEAAKMTKEQMKKMEEEKDKMMAAIQELELKLNQANDSIASYESEKKKMYRKAAVMQHGFDSDQADSIVDKFNSLADETFSAMTEMLSAGGMPPWLKKKDEKKPSEATSQLVKTNIVEILDNVEEVNEVNLSVGGEHGCEVDSVRAALVDFVYARLGSNKFNKGE